MCRGIISLTKMKGLKNHISDIARGGSVFLLAISGWLVLHHFRKTDDGVIISSFATAIELCDTCNTH
jgi:hypothetical protein